MYTLVAKEFFAQVLVLWGLEVHNNFHSPVCLGHPRRKVVSIITIITILSLPRYIGITKRLTISVIVLSSITILRYYWNIAHPYSADTLTVIYSTDVHVHVAVPEWQQLALLSQNARMPWNVKSLLMKVNGPPRGGWATPRYTAILGRPVEQAKQAWPCSQLQKLK